MRLSLSVIVFEKSKSELQGRIEEYMGCFEKWSISPAPSKLLLGIHPTLMHVPPKSPLSTIAVFTPCDSALKAAAKAAAPPPIIMSSYLLVSDISSTQLILLPSYLLHATNEGTSVISRIFHLFNF